MLPRWRRAVLPWALTMSTVGLTPSIAVAAASASASASASTSASASASPHDPKSSVEASDPSSQRTGARSGRGLMIAGGTLLGIGVVGRVAIEGFWVGPARLEAREPFGAWSIPNIALFTAFSNVWVVPGLVLTAVGVARHGRWRRGDPSFVPRPWQGPRARKVGWMLLGGGLGLWAVTRILASPVLRACSTNGCAYGYLESTYWLSLGAAVSGVVVVGLNPSGTPRRVTAMPWWNLHAAGWTVGGRF